MIFQDLSKRFLGTLIVFAVIATLLVFAYNPPLQWVIALLVALVGAVAMWEFVKLTKIDQKEGYLQLLMAMTLVVVLGFFISTEQSSYGLLPLILLFFAIIVLFLAHFNQVQGAIKSICTGFFGLFYIAVPLGLLLKILYLYSSCKIGHVGRFWLLYLLIVTKITDVGAYFGGRIFGNKRLASRISPKKTVAGALVGFLSAILFSWMFYLFSRSIPNFYLTSTQSIWLGALLGILGQIGDLGESLLKRDAQVKDSNRLPGFGGVLDMLDSLLFTVPVIYFFLYFC